MKNYKQKPIYKNPQIIYNCPEHRLSPIGAVILSALTRLVNEEKDNAKLRGSCYVAIGKLGLKLPSLVNKDVSMIQTFFDAMSTEDKDTQMSVQVRKIDDTCQDAT